MNRWLRTCVSSSDAIHNRMDVRWRCIMRCVAIAATLPPKEKPAQGGLSPKETLRTKEARSAGTFHWGRVHWNDDVGRSGRSAPGQSARNCGLRSPALSQAELLLTRGGEHAHSRRLRDDVSIRASHPHDRHAQCPCLARLGPGAAGL